MSRSCITCSSLYKARHGLPRRTKKIKLGKGRKMGWMNICGLPPPIIRSFGPLLVPDLGVVPLAHLNLRLATHLLLSSNNIMYSKSSMHQKLWFFPLPKSSIPLRHRLDGLCYCWFMIHIIEYGDQEWLGSSLVPGYIPFQEIRSRSFSKSPRLHDDCRSVEWGPSPAPTLFWAGWKLSGGETRYREI